MWFVRSICLSLLLACMPSVAQVVYDYNGQPFETADPPYSTTDRIVGSFQTATPLSPWLIDADISARVTAFSFSDGQQVLTSMDSVVCVFRVTTDATGAIVDWRMDLRPAGRPPLPTRLPFLQSSRLLDEAGTGLVGEGPCDEVFPAEIGRVERRPGDWEGGGQIPSVPVLYRYDGAPFTDFYGSTPDEQRALDLAFRLAGPLPPFLNEVDIAPLVELLELDYGLGPIFDPSFLQVCRLRVSTDAYGRPVQWDGFISLLIQPPVGGPYRNWTFSETGDQIFLGGTHCLEGVARVEASNDVPGRWYGGAVRSVPALGPVGLSILVISMLFFAVTGVRRS